MPGHVERMQFDLAAEAVWSELNYQNSLPRRTDDEAKDVPGFLTLARTYVRKAEDHWADQPGVIGAEGKVVVEDALKDLRKLAAIFMRAMIYNGVRAR